jgi:hypothetical protein
MLKLTPSLAILTKRRGVSERMLPRSFRGPRLLARASVFLGEKMTMCFVYLDEFGHIGPFMSRKALKYNESPVFGLAGIILPETAVRPLATKFLKLKEHVFKSEICSSGVLASHWEKKGVEIFTPKLVAKYPHFRSTGFRLINYIRDLGGHIFYYGRVKILNSVDVNSIGLYTTILSHAIRQLESFAATNNCNFIMVVDEHSARKQLLITASKTMYGQSPARHMLSPPFEVESYINQNIQAADWIAAIVGRLWSYQTLPGDYSDHEKIHKYFWHRLHTVATYSTVLPR